MHTFYTFLYFSKRALVQLTESYKYDTLLIVAGYHHGVDTEIDFLVAGTPGTIHKYKPHLKGARS